MATLGVMLDARFYRPIHLPIYASAQQLIPIGAFAAAAALGYLLTSSVVALLSGASPLALVVVPRGVHNRRASPRPTIALPLHPSGAAT